MHTDLATWLARTPKGKAPRKRVRKVSAKRAKEQREYTNLRKDFLRENPYCEAVTADGPCTIHATQVHHTARRGKNYLNVDSFMPVCANCHRWIETHANLARELGWITT